MHAAQWAPGDEVVVRADARRFESWERSVANQLGLGAAVDYALALGVDAIAARVAGARRRRCARSSADVPGLTLHDRGVEPLRHRDVHRRRRRRVRARGVACATQRINISVSTIDFARYDFEARGLDAVARASVHYYNTEDELDRLVDSGRPREVRAPCASAS